MSNRTCSVFGCSNVQRKCVGRIPPVKFYSLPGRPYEAERRKLWIDFMGRKNRDGSPWQPTHNARICSDHFINNIKCQNPLEPNYNPTIFPNSHNGNLSYRGSRLNQTMSKNGNKFLENWNPENSNRETRKLTRKLYRECSRSCVYDNRGRLVKHGQRNVCDCLEDGCPGCHMPCPRCDSPKCGHECRVNRRWTYESVEIEGKNIVIKNKFK